jgi:hypothetical protein
MTKMKTIDAGTKPGMTPGQLKDAYYRLGLTLDELARVLDTDKKSLRCMMGDPMAKMFRHPPPRLVRLLEAYLSGYRPPDWPD